jgi:hypothetical protein
VELVNMRLRRPAPVELHNQPHLPPGQRDIP